MQVTQVLSIHKFADGEYSWEFVIADGKVHRKSFEKDYAKFVEDPKSAESRARAWQEAHVFAQRETNSSDDSSQE